MMRLTKRVFSAFLAFVMVFTMLPLDAWAADNNVTGNSAMAPLAVLPDDENTHYITYIFKNGDQVVSTQILTKDDILRQPATPEAPEGKKFVGWKTAEGQEPVYGRVPEVQEDQQITYLAQFEDVIYVTFLSQDGGKVVAVKEVTSSGTVDGDGIAFLPDSGTMFLYWSLEPGGEAFDFGTPITEDTTLYAVCAQGYWIVFDSDGGTHVDTQYVAEGGKAVEPTRPTKIGYDFEGWTTPDGKDYNFNDPVNGNLTLKAKWVGQMVDYTVVFWLQDPNNEGQYNYYDFVERTGRDGAIAGTEVTYDTLWTVINQNVPKSKEYVRTIAEFKELDSSTPTIAGDGTTVVNVYYDRIDFTYTFQLGSTWVGGFRDGHYEYNTMTIGGGTYSDENGIYYEVHAKYEEDISAVWPSQSTAKFSFSFAGWSHKNDMGGGGDWVTKRLTVTAGMLPSEGRTEVTLTALSNGTESTVNYWFEQLPDQTGDTYSYRGTTYVRSDKYSQDYSGSGSLTAKEIGGMTRVVAGYSLSGPNYDINVPDYDGYNFLYTRNRYELSFDTQGGPTEVNPVQDIMFEENLSKYKPTQYVEGETTKTVNDVVYTFTGWYTTAECYQKFDFNSTMPNENLKLFAGWAKQKVNVTAFITAVNSGETKTYEVELGEKVSQADLNNWLEDNDQNVDDLYGWYQYKDGAYTAWNFDAAVNEDIILVAIFGSGAYKVTYEHGEGTGAVTDDKSYSIGSQAVVKPATGITPPEGKKFLYWQAEDGEIYYPNDVINITGDITLIAKFADPDNMVTLTYHGNGGTLPGGEDSETVSVTANSMVSLESNSFVNSGYEFVGWSMNKDADPNDADLLQPGREVRVTADGKNDLYAIWKLDTAEYTINYYVDDVLAESAPYADAPASGSAQIGTTVSPVFLNSFEKDNTTFVLDEDEGNLSVEIKAEGENVLNVYYYGQYTVTYRWADETTVPDGAQPPEDEEGPYTKDTDVTVLQPKGVENYKFNGWTLDGTEVTGSFKMPAKNVTLIGSWTQTDVTYTVEHYIQMLDDTDKVVYQQVEDATESKTAKVDTPVTDLIQPLVKENLTATDEPDGYVYSFEYEKYETAELGVNGVIIDGSVIRLYYDRVLETSDFNDGKLVTAGDSTDDEDNEIRQGSVTVKTHYVGGSRKGDYEDVVDFVYNKSNMIDLKISVKDDAEYRLYAINAVLSGGNKWNGSVLDNVVGGSTVHIYLVPVYTVEYYKVDGSTTTKIEPADTGTYADVSGIDLTNNQYKNDSLKSQFTTILLPTETGYTYKGWYTDSNLTGDTVDGNKPLNNVKDYVDYADEDRVIKFYAGHKTAKQYQYTINYYWVADKNNPDAQTIFNSNTREAAFGQVITAASIRQEISNYTQLPAADQDSEVTISADEAANVINVYYYKNVKLKADSASHVYDGTEKTVDTYKVLDASSGSELDDVTFADLSAKGTGKLVGEYPVEFYENDAKVENAATLNSTLDDKQQYYVVAAEEGKLTITDTGDGFNPEDVVKKTHDNRTYGLGDTVTFTITVTNIYNEQKSLSIKEGLNVTYKSVDSSAGINYGATIPETLAAGETITIIAEYVVTEENITSGKLVNTVTVTLGDESFKDEDEVDLEDAEAELTVTKKVVEEDGFRPTGENGAYKLGETIKYKIVVTNTGNQTLTDINVKDEMTHDSVDGNTLTGGVLLDENDGPSNGVIEKLVPKGQEGKSSATFYYTYTVKESDLGKTLVNVATATSGDTEGKNDPEVVQTEDLKPSLSVTKTADRETAAVGETINYTITVTNNGNQTLNSIKVTDPLTGLNQEISTLKPGEASEAFKTSYTVKVSDLIAGSVVNTATATVENGPTASGTAEVDVTGKLDISVNLASGKFPYDGEPHTVSGIAGVTYVLDGGTSVDAEGASFTVGDTTFTLSCAENTATATETDVLRNPDGTVGSYLVTAETSDITVMMGGQDVTDKVNVMQVIDGSLTITPAEVTLVSADLTKTYDGTALKNGETKLKTEDGWVKGQGATYEFTGSQTNVGTSKNTFNVKPNEGTNLSNYDIQKTEGTLTVTANTDEVIVTILGNSDTKPYTGSEQSVEGYTITGITVGGEESQLYPAESVLFVGDASDKEASGTYVGEYTMALNEEDFQHDTSNKNFSKVQFVVTPGKLTITPGPYKPVAKTHEEKQDGSKFALNETVTFPITVINIYSTTAKVTLTEQEGVFFEGGRQTAEGVLTPGQKMIFNAYYVITEQDILNESFMNTVEWTLARIGGTDKISGTATNIVDVVAKEPLLKVTKSITSTDGNKDGVYGLNETITYSIVVENTGNVTAKNITVQDVLEIGGVKNEPVTLTSVTEGFNGELKPGKTAEFTYQHKVTQEDLGKTIVNTATATAEDPEGENVPSTPGVVTTTTEQRNPHLKVVKSVENEGTGANGAFKLDETIQYKVVLTNDGNVTLNYVTIRDYFGATEDTSTFAGTDITSSLVGWSEFDGTLEPDESVEFTYSYTVKESDLGKTIVNQVTDLNALDATNTSAETNDDEGTVMSETDAPNPDLKVKKTVLNKEKAPFDLDETIHYQITVSNTGNVTLTNVSVEDVLKDSLGNTIETLDLTGAKNFSLAPKGHEGDSKTFNVSYTVKEEDLGKTLVNTVTAASKQTQPDPDDPDNDDHDETDGEQTEKPSPNMSVTKEVVKKQTSYRVGDVITYQITVTNTGNTTIHNIKLTDVMQASGDVKFTSLDGGKLENGVPVRDSLAPKTAWVVTCQYTVQLADADSDGNVISNKVVVTSDGGPSDDAETSGEDVDPIYTVVIKYQNGAGADLHDPAVVKVHDGQKYSVDSPDVPGYHLTNANQKTVSGTLDADSPYISEEGVLTLVVVYARNPVEDDDDDPVVNPDNDPDETTEETEDEVDPGVYIEDPDDYTLTPITEEEPPLADLDVGDHTCCIMHFLLMLAAMVVLGFYTDSKKKHQARIFELKRTLAMEKGKNPDGDNSQQS